MTYSQAIDYILEQELDEQIINKALNYIKFLKTVNEFKIKLTTNEERRLKEILESK